MMSTKPLVAAAPANSANGGGVNTSRPIACTNCHSAKVKCNFQSPCDRCVRLHKTCIPHVSQQGRGKKKRKAGEAKDGKKSKAARKTSAGSSKRGGNKSLAQQATEDVLCKSLGSVIAMQFHPHHYGIRFLIRSWVSFAIRRRSFMLLSRAALLASRVGLSMDDVMCEKDVVVTADGVGDGDAEGAAVEEAVAAAVAAATGSTQASCGGSTSYHQDSVDFLYPALITPADQQDLGDTRLRWSEIPSDLLASAGCCSKSAGLGAPVLPDDLVMDCERRKEEEAKVKACQNATDFASVVEDKDEQEILAPMMGDRWIFVREMKQGQSRYFCSPAFERDIASWESIKDTWAKNEQEVVSLFHAPSDKAPYVRALMHQITLHSKANMSPRASRCSSKILVKNAGGNERKLVQVDQISCMKIVNVDCCYSYNEYVPVEKETAETLALMSSVASATSGSRGGSLASQPPQAVTPPLPPLDSTNTTGGSLGTGTTEWLNLDQIDELGDLNELMDFLDEARSDFGIL